MAKKSKTKKKSQKKTVKNPQKDNEIRHLTNLIKVSNQSVDGMSEFLDNWFRDQAIRLELQLIKVKSNQ